MSSVKDLKLILDGYKKSDSKAFEAAVSTFGKPYSKFLKGDLERLIGMLGPSKITVPTRRSSSVGPKKSPKGKKPRSRSRSASKGKSPAKSPKRRSSSKGKKTTPKRRASSKSGPCDRDGKYMCSKDEMCNTTQKKCVPSTFRTTKAHRFLVGDDGNLYVGSQATMELVADSKGISRRRIKETKEAAMKVTPSPKRRSSSASTVRYSASRSDSQATIKMNTPSPTMKLPTPRRRTASRSRSRASSKGKGKRRTASRSRSASRASSKGKGKRRSSASRSASRQRSASRDPSFTKCADDFVRGKYCADDKPFCNVKTGNCTKIMSKTAPKYTHAGRTAYAPEEDIIKRFESYHKKLTTRGRSRSRSKSAKRASKSKSRSASAKRGRSRSRSASAKRGRSRSRSQSASAKRYTLKGCQSYDAPDCPAEKPYCGSSGACIKTKPTGGNYIQLNGKKIYGQVATLESLMKSVGAKSPILKDDGKKAATPKKARRSTSRSASRRRSTSRSASRRRSTSRSASKPPVKKSPPRRNTPIPSGSWAKGCYAPDAEDCEDGTYCGTSGKCIKTKGTYVLELSGKKIYGSMDALTKLASTAGVSESKIKKSSELKVAAKKVGSPAKPARGRSRSRSASAVRARSRSTSKGKARASPAKAPPARASPAKKPPNRDITDADIVSAFQHCMEEKEKK